MIRIASALQLVSLASRPSHFVLPHELESSAPAPRWEHFLAAARAGVAPAAVHID
jgi:hypothetical protein